MGCSLADWPRGMRILMGEPPDRVAARDALANPEALDAFVALAR